MPDHRPAASRSAEIVLTILASVSAVVLLIGLAHTLVTGEPMLWPLAAAIVLAACLTLMRSLRRSRGAGARPRDSTPTLGAAAAVRGETQPRPARQP